VNNRCRLFFINSEVVRIHRNPALLYIWNYTNTLLFNNYFKRRIKKVKKCDWLFTFNWFKWNTKSNMISWEKNHINRLYAWNNY